MNKSYKKYTLCLETTSSVCGVSICENDKLIYKCDQDLGLNHSVTLFNSIDKAFSKLKIDMKSVDLIKVSSGPGSFTGIRIGISAALGLAIPYYTSIQYIDTLDTFYKDLYKDKSLLISLIDARNDRAYISIYNGVNHKKLLNDQVIYIKDLVYLINKHFKSMDSTIYFLGPGALAYKEFLILNIASNIKFDFKNNRIESGNLRFVKSKASKIPQINYVLASKAEREHKW